MSKSRRASIGRQIPPIETAAPPVSVIDAALEVQDPPVRTQPAQTQDRRFWPKGEPMPEFYVRARARLTPCPKCRRLLLDNSGQAVVVQSAPAGYGVFYCKSCGHRWKLPAREV